MQRGWLREDNAAQWGQRLEALPMPTRAAGLIGTAPRCNTGTI
jgi:hypothetical protein